jgi:hypothetical protein
MPPTEPLAQQDYQSGTLTDAIEFLKRTRSELRELRKVRIWLDRIQVFDINGDYFEIVGVGYPDRAAVALLGAHCLQSRNDSRGHRKPLQRVQNRPPPRLGRRSGNVGSFVVPPLGGDRSPGDEERRLKANGSE